MDKSIKDISVTVADRFGGYQQECRICRKILSRGQLVVRVSYKKHDVPLSFFVGHKTECCNDTLLIISAFYTKQLADFLKDKVANKIAIGEFDDLILIDSRLFISSS